MNIRIERTSGEQGRGLIRELLDRFSPNAGDCEAIVRDILEDVRQNGDQAVINYTRKYDAPEMTVAQLRVREEEFAKAEREVNPELKLSIQLAAARIRAFHEREMEDSWFITREDGSITGRMVRPVDRAGLYVPGGQGGSTPLVSSVLMNGIPALIAGVGKRVMMTPPNREGEINPALLVAAREVGISEVYKAGSAWAIGALAHGTQSIPRVDVIVGPGNRFVTEAKKQVNGRVRIDMIAGPSEVLIIADHTGQPAYIAADMLAQAEHDPEALPLLITTEQKIADEVVKELEKQVAGLKRQDIARLSLKNKGLILLADSVAEAVELANDIAIEHLELQIADPWSWLTKIRHAGAIFLGLHTPEAAGDYVAGPNHVLPTMGTARISSALGVETFLKKSSVIAYSREALLNDCEHILRLADLEGLTAHGNSVRIRMK
ncbi:MAG: histidinol dehydrogenase [Desulfobulbaceae bacterium]|nr:histidinol dehydrogenase [Desulfobulbaceae bacterium]